MTLPMYMLATRPQNSSGWSWISSGPGRSPQRINAASSIAVVPEPGMPSVSSGTSAAGLRIVCGFGRGHALYRSSAEFFGVFGYRLFDAVGDERRDGRTRAGKHAHEKADEGAVEKRKARVLQILPVRQQIA